MRILFVTEQFPYPLHDGGTRRTYHVLRGLSQKHEVWLLSHQLSPADEAGVELLRKMCRVTTVEEPGVWIRMAWNCVRRGIRRYPGFVLKNWSDRILRAADSLLRAHHFEAIHFNALDTACYALVHDWPQLKVFDTHNCLSAMAAQVSRRSAGRLKRAVFAREAGKLRATELAVCRRMDATLVCSLPDADAFREIYPAGTYVVAPNGVDADYFGKCETIHEEPGNLVFTGAMGYYPNEEAVLFFCREILPLLSDCRPSLRFFVVGKNPSAKVRALDNGSSIVVTGEVHDVRPYVARAQVFVVPLLTGSGTRLKILEAFAMGKAVVSTSLGVQGIPAVDGKEIFLADDAPSLARQIRQALASPDLRTQLGQAAARLVRERFDWRHVHTTVLDTYEELLDRGMPSTCQPAERL